MMEKKPGKRCGLSFLFSLTAVVADDTRLQASVAGSHAPDLVSSLPLLPRAPAGSHGRWDALSLITNTPQVPAAVQLAERIIIKQHKHTFVLV